MTYKCPYPHCNKSYKSAVSLSNHQRKCGKDAEKILKKRVKRRKMEDAQHALEERSHEQGAHFSTLWGGEDSWVAGGSATPHSAADIGSQTEGIAQLEDVEADPMIGVPPIQSRPILRRRPRSINSRRLPDQFHDVLPPAPPQPEPELLQQHEELPDVIALTPPIDSAHSRMATSTAADVYETTPNSYNVFRRYFHGRPSIYPLTPSISEVLNSPNYEAVQTAPERRPWWSAFGHSLKYVQKNILGPFSNASTLLLLGWAHSGSNSKSNPEVNRLVHEVIQAPGFDPNDLKNFDAARDSKRLDHFDDSEIDPKDFLFGTKDGWIEGTVTMSVPCEGRKHKSERDAKTIDIPGVYYRRPLEIIKAALNDPSVETHHWIPYHEYWQPSETAPPERIYTELYNSDHFIEEHGRLVLTAAIESQLECVIMAIMIWSDSTHLAAFGDASLWPIYMYFGNQSKYIRSKVNTFSANHLAYIPKLSNQFQDFYTEIYNIAASSDIVTHCKRELIHLIWLLILDEDFMHAYVHGLEHKFIDGILRLVFPRLFTYAADYPEKILLACIKYLARCPCPRCYVLKDKVSDMGRKLDIKNRVKNTRVDSKEVQDDIALARKWLFEMGLPINNHNMKNLLGPWSLTPVQSAFSKRFFPHGLNHYDMFVPDLMHEFELGVWKSIFTHLMRILQVAGNDQVQELNKRFRKVPTFGRGTIRRFSKDASSMNRRAARDFEDLLQCSIPAFDNLLPSHYDTMHNLLFELCTWHALAKLRMHTETTIRDLEHSTRRLGFIVRDFKRTICAEYQTKELPADNAPRGRHKAALTQLPSQLNKQAGTKPKKQFNLTTYKWHALADYPTAIRRFGPTDGYTTEVGETQHKTVKRYYSRASKAQHTRSVAKQQRQEQILKKLVARYKASWQDTNKRTAREPKKTFTDPHCHYEVSSDKKTKVNVLQWPGEDLANDEACKDFLPQLQGHLLSRLLEKKYDGDEETYTRAERGTVNILNNTIFQHKQLRVNYTTYDLRRDEDTIKPRTKPFIMVLSHEDQPEEDGLPAHPYWYARVLGIYHAFVTHMGPKSKTQVPKRMDFLRVRWFGRNSQYDAGWQKRRLHLVGYVPGGFGFLDPALIIRGAHLIPAFAFGRTSEILGPSIARLENEGDEDWKYYYVNMFVDCDMFMRYRGGGVGHISTREAMKPFLSDRHADELRAVENVEDIIGDHSFNEITANDSDEQSEHDSVDMREDIDEDDVARDASDGDSEGGSEGSGDSDDSETEESGLEYID